MSVFKNLENPPKVLLDSFPDLIEMQLDRLELLTDGEFIDRSKSSSVYPFIATQVFTGAELLYAANKAGELLVYKLINSLTGINRESGSKATGLVRFSLETTRTTVFVIPAQTQVFCSISKLRYYTTSQLIIQPGTLTAEVTVEAERDGVLYNANAGEIDSISIPFSGLQSIINNQKVIGGKEVETEESFGIRLRRALRPKVLITIKDFEELFTDLYGQAVPVKAIPFLSADKLINDERGSIHVFMTGEDGRLLSNSEKSSLASLARENAPIATRLFISNVDLLEVNVEVVARFSDTANIQTTVNAIFNLLRQLVSFRSVAIGESLINQKILSELHKVDGVEWIEAVRLNDSFGSLAMPTAWALPRIKSLSLIATNSTSDVYNNVLFYKEDINDPLTDGDD